ncbi:MAG TPA: protoporphyrinogen oxidase [Waddliaceae bacterium]
MKRYIILGAGISGLSLAWFLKRRFENRANIIILEKEDRAGGWIQTVQQDGFVFEQGPRGCRPKGITGTETLRLIEELGLQKEVVFANPAAHLRYLLIRKKLRALPSGVFSFLTFPLAWKIVCGIFQDLYTPPFLGKDESIHAFVSRRFGNTLAESLFDPLATGIYGGDIRQLSVKACFPLLSKWEQDGGSVLKGAFLRRIAEAKCFTASKFVEEAQKHPLFSFKKGMATLTQELTKSLEKDLKLSSSVAGVNLYPHRVEVKQVNGTVIEGDHLFSTLPAKTTASLLSSSRLAYLSHIPEVSVAVVNLGYYKQVLKKRGYGYLIPSQEKEQIMGMTWDSEIFPQQNTIPEETRLTVMMGGAHNKQIEQYSLKQIKEVAYQAVQEHLQIPSLPDSVSIKIAREAIPQYLVGHNDKISEIENMISKMFRNLTLCGSSYYGVAVNDCIAKSRSIVDNFIYT